jgi:hypothetical protein
LHWDHWSISTFNPCWTTAPSTRRNVTVEATSPLKAGEVALGQPLALEGKSVRAIVWRLTAGFVPLRVTLYDVDMVADATPTE